jgi:hypothetical protein
LAVANKFQGKPVVFIAVNSGTTSTSVSKYLRKHQITWPTIVDSDRSLEKQANVPEVSLTNIWQARVIDSTGKVIRAGATDLEKTGERALSGAKWNVDPTSIPNELKPIWAQIEFGSYSSAAVSLRRHLKSRKPEIKTAATTLNDYVTKQLTDEIAAAAAAEKSGNLWQAYRVLQTLPQRYKGFEIPKSVTTDVNRLAANETVKTELSANRKLELAKKTARSTSKSARARVIRQLEVIVKQFPNTEAAKQASAILLGNEAQKQRR